MQAVIIFTELTLRLNNTNLLCIMTQLPESLFSRLPAPIIENASGKGGVVLVCEHAGQILPESLGELGLDAETMSSHIAWDIGAAGLSQALSKQLDAPLILQRYSRLVFDCNRNFDAPDAIVEKSDGMTVPLNKNLSVADRQRRFDQVYLPFHTAIDGIIDDCLRRGQQPTIISIHSFTPVFMGQQRILELGVIHDFDARFADRMIGVARNEPYAPRDGITHTLNRHGIDRKLLNVMFEVRNDLIADPSGQEQWAKRLSGMISAANNTESGTQ
jgi:predicted N-formylglutamate amidohydrolase